MKNLAHIFIYIITALVAVNCSHTISGFVRTSEGEGIGEAQIIFITEDTTKTRISSFYTETDSLGYYKRKVRKGWSGTATPVKENFEFKPVLNTFRNVGDNRTNENYTGMTSPPPSPAPQVPFIPTWPTTFTLPPETFQSGFEVEAGFDIDQDSTKEFAVFDADNSVLTLFEARCARTSFEDTCDNAFDPVWSYKFSGLAGGLASIMEGDIDGNGRRELIICADTPVEQPAILVWERGSGIDILPRDPTATFQPPRDQNGMIKPSTASIVGDFDNDKKNELLLLYRGGANLLMAIVSVEGELSADSVRLTVEFLDTSTESLRAAGVGVGDIDHNGSKEIVVVCEGEKAPIRLYSSEGGKFHLEKEWRSDDFPAEYHGSSANIPIEDFNGDERLEAYLFSNGSNASVDGGQPVPAGVWLVEFDNYLSHAFDAENWTPIATLGTTSLRGGVTGDGDSDGKPDLYVVGPEARAVYQIEYNGSKIEHPDEKVYSAFQDSAQIGGSISGKIYDERTGEPLPGANVFLEGTTIGAASDADGSYTIENVPPGNYTIVASFIGYQRKEAGVTVSVVETVNINFSMSDGRGACSSHYGVNCGAGPDSDGSVICNDGWRDSSVGYSEVCVGEDSKYSAYIIAKDSTTGPLVPTNISSVGDLDGDSRHECLIVRGVNRHQSSMNGAFLSAQAGDAASMQENDPRPPAPNWLAVKRIATNQVELSWKDNSETEVSFKIYRVGTSAPVGTVGMDVRHFVDPGSPATGTYYIVASNSAGNSPLPWDFKSIPTMIETEISVNHSTSSQTDGLFVGNQGGSGISWSDFVISGQDVLYRGYLLIGSTPTTWGSAPVYAGDVPGDFTSPTGIALGTDSTGGTSYQYTSMASGSNLPVTFQVAGAGLTVKQTTIHLPGTQWVLCCWEIQNNNSGNSSTRQVRLAMHLDADAGGQYSRIDVGEWVDSLSMIYQRNNGSNKAIGMALIPISGTGTLAGHHINTFGMFDTTARSNLVNNPGTGSVPNPPVVADLEMTLISDLGSIIASQSARVIFAIAAGNDLTALRGNVAAAQMFAALLTTSCLPPP